jgi:YegS/Rv2252/BmrU family lipid kinase
VRVALLANPRSGAGDAHEVERLLAERGATVEAFALDERDRATASKPDRIVVAGGDGSIGCAAETAARAGVPLAVIPTGTANDFARSVGVPDEIEEAAALAVEGSRTRRLDLGRVDDQRPFVNAVSVGLSPVAAQEAHGLKGVLGPLAYAVGALRAGLFAQPVECEVRVDGELLLVGRAWQVTVGSTGAFGGGAEIDADPGDGALDAVALEAGSRAWLIVHAFGMRAGRLERQRGALTGRGKQVEVATEASTGFNVDGEIVDSQRVRLTLEPQAFELIIG